MLNEIGLVGLGVMGKNIALNLSDKGVTINNIPDEYNHWFNYKGLTFVIS